jgi:hypothetical protein
MGRIMVAAALAVALVGCTADPPSGDAGRDQATAVRMGPLTPRDPERIDAVQAAAIVALAAATSSAAPPPGHHGHSDGGLATTVVLTTDERAGFEEQWERAVAAVAGLDTPDEATAAGYTRAAVQGAGVGVHWVDWTLIDRPFDPARPAMLLFDERDGKSRLVGFSYWVRTPAPTGFAGTNDVWHQHTNLCIVNGWVDREMSATSADCAGSFLAGADLWMLHAWVVPQYPNRWGDFAVLHPALCPSVHRAPDIARCPSGAVSRAGQP